MSVSDGMKGDTPAILYNMCLGLDKLYSEPIDGLDESIRKNPSSPEDVHGRRMPAYVEHHRVETQEQIGTTNCGKSCSCPWQPRSEEDHDGKEQECQSEGLIRS